MCQVVIIRANKYVAPTCWPSNPNMVEGTAAYNDALALCMATHCENALQDLFNDPSMDDCIAYYELMKADMSPYGDYGNGGFYYNDDAFSYYARC